MSRKIPPDRLMYSIGGRPGSREVIVTISTSPIWPSSIAFRTAMKCGSKRRLKPTINVALVSSTTFRQALTRSMSRSIGFSQKTALPAREKRSMRSAWVSVGVQMITALISVADSIASIDRVWHPYCRSIDSAAAGTASVTATSVPLGLSFIVFAWTLPMRPAPRRPNLTVIRFSFIWHNQCRIQFPVNGIETVLRCHRVHSSRAFQRKRCRVRRKHHIFQIGQGMIRSEWLLLEYVQPGSANQTHSQGINQLIFVNHSATSSGDDERGRLHHGKRFCPDQTRGF